MSSSTVSKLDSLQGLGGAKRLVLRLAADSQGTHAVLLYGAEGAGKSALAEALAQAWLCKQPTPEGACGICQACQAFDRDRSADLLRIVPRPPSNLIRLESITPYGSKEGEELSLIEFFRTAPLVARSKVAILQETDRLVPRAANALLKTLEEPHAHARLILTTSYVGAVIPTILSRCLCIACELPDVGDGAAETSETRASEGAPGRLTTIRAHEEAYASLARFVKELRAYTPSRALVASETFRAVCDDLERALGVNGRSAQAEALRTMGSLLPDDALKARWAPLVAEAHRRIVGNGQANLVFDALFARMLNPE